MKFLLFLALILSLAFLPGSSLFADDDDDDDDGGSVFDEPEAEEGEGEEVESEPVPRTYVFKDYRLEMDTEDGRWWKELPLSDEQRDEHGYVLSLLFKHPKSDDHFDVQMSCRSWKHNINLSFNDGTQISTGSVDRMAEKFWDITNEQAKEARDPEKPKKTRLSREIKSCTKWSLTGLGLYGSLPVRQEAYFFRFKDKTYYVSVYFTTTSAKNERITDMVQDMLKTLREKKQRRR